MLMDLFYNTAVATRKKRRTHFHEFMLDVHQSKYLKRKLFIIYCIPSSFQGFTNSNITTQRGAQRYTPTTQ